MADDYYTRHVNGATALIEVLNEMTGKSVRISDDMAAASSMFAKVLREKFLPKERTAGDDHMACIRGSDSSREVTARIQSRVAGAHEERARIMAALETCRPTEQPYTRRDWALEERGKRDLWAKIMKALGEGAK